MLAEIGSPAALDLRGKIAIANCKIIYRRFREIFAELRVARVQRLHWCGTGTRNPAYSDVRYVEELIGPDTSNTLPAVTLRAFREHGRVRGATLTEGFDEARDRLDRLHAFGIDLGAVGEKLQNEAVTAAGEGARPRAEETEQTPAWHNR
jgi:transaldolase/transaldolase/glucose-6-phosphate isomerase